MNSLKPTFTPFHAPAGLRRLLIAALAVLLLGVITAIPALASGSGTWTLTGSLNVNRYLHTATLLQNGQVLVAGSIYTASAELYNPSTGVWITTGSMRSERWDFTATLLSNGQVLVGGGTSYVNNQIVDLASAELYNPSTGTWTTTGSMPTARAFQTATLLSNGQVLVAGGERALASAELYNPSTGTWTTTGSLPTALALHTATLLQNGQVLVAGGQGFNYLSSAELYNPSTGTWTLTGSMHTARALHTATLLSNGQVLVAGGQPSGDLGCPNDTASAELYNPSTGAWSTTGSLNQARDSQTATLLTNGQVLVAGGQYNEPECVSDTFLTSAELYTP